MTDQHPLTDELIDELAAKFMSEPSSEQVVNRDHDMRAAADWQLTQVLEFIAADPMLGEYVKDYIYKAMRSTNTQEDDND